MRMPKQKIEELGSLSKSEKIKLKKLYSRGRAAYDFIQNLSKASGLSKKKVEKFLQANYFIRYNFSVSSLCYNNESNAV